MAQNLENHKTREVVGECKYAPDFRCVSGSRPMIHAEKVRLINPKTKQSFPEIRAALPEDYEEFKKRLVRVQRVSV